MTGSFLARISGTCAGRAHRLWSLLLKFLELIGLRKDIRVDQEAQLARFRLHHSEFRNLLTANNSFLETLAELEQKRQSDELFEPAWVERRAMRGSVDIFRMVSSLNAISDGRFAALQAVSERITAELTETFERHKACSAPLELDLAEVTAGHVGIVGGKMANLGELRNRRRLPTPDGFVLTTEAFHAFLRAGKLEPLLRFGRAEECPEAGAAESLHELLESAPVPPELVALILEGYDRLVGRLGYAPRVAVRSSAQGEDSDLSYAGQFLTVLNVDRTGLQQAWQRVVASLFSPDAVHYRRLHGISSGTPAMAVGFVAMVDALASGVMFTRDPNHPSSGRILIHAVRGLGVALVDGLVSPEIIEVARGTPLSVHSKRSMDDAPAGVAAGRTGSPGSAEGQKVSDEPLLSEHEALELARTGMNLETHFGGPQDVEWAIDRQRAVIVLQSRPLRMLREAAPPRPPVPGAQLLLQGGDVAFPGVGTGPAFHMHERSDLDQFPEGAVLVAPRPSPRFVRIMERARAIVTDVGSTTGHMASLARELRVPTLLNTRCATRALQSGTLITVDAHNSRVYAGAVSGLEASPDVEERGTEVGWIRSTPAFQLLELASDHILPLNLTDPHSHAFTPENCRTLHDVARFVHEKSFSEMFRMGETLGDMRAASYQLDVFLAIDLYVLDLGNGVEPPSTGRKVKPAHVRSVPLRALLEGMLDRKIQRFGPKPMDVGGFFTIMMRHAVTSPEVERTFQDPSYALVSDRYLNYTARVGYHFGVVDTYCGRTPNKNYISMQFRGGAADPVRRGRRSRAIGEILGSYGFLVEVKGDAVSARLSKTSQEETCRQLTMLGRLLQYVRQMDVAMVSEEAVARVRDAFLRGDYDVTRAGGAEDDQP